MLSYTDLKPGTYIVLNGEPHVVLDFSFSKKQRQQATVQTKLKNIKTGNIIDRAFHQSDKVEKADLETRDVRFLYQNQNKGEFWFCVPDDPSDRFSLDSDLMGTGSEFIKSNSVILALIFEDEIIGVKIPIKMDLKVKEAPPAVRGNTAQGATKQVILETGATLITPMFINEGDIVRVNTEKGEYVERVKKQ